MRESNSGGTDLSTILLVVFIVLKLCHVINWSWWWVLSPLWIVIILGTIGLFVLTFFLWKHDQKKRKALEQETK